jgi:putative flippase GtrA
LRGAPAPNVSTNGSTSSARTSVGGRPRAYDPRMPAPTTRLLTRWETSLGLLRTHSALGPLVRFYFRRREQILYLAVGGWNTVFGYGVWAVLQYLLGGYVHYLVVVVLSWPLAVLNAYVGYRFVVFHSHGPLLTELPRFSLVYLATLVANLALLPVALNALPFSIYVIQALFTTGVVVVSYLGHKYFSFRQGRQRDGVDSAAYDPTSRSGG